MNLSETFEAVSPSVVGFVSRARPSRAGDSPLFPLIFGTGFFVHEDGIVATNGHVIEAFEQVPNNPRTGAPAVAGLIFFPWKDNSGQVGQRGMLFDVRQKAFVSRFSSTGEWFGRSIPDIGLVQLNVRKVQFLDLACEDFSIRTGMPIATAGYPMGDDPLTVFNKVNQLGPFLRRGIVSSVFPFATAQPHGFTIDVMQQGGSSGSPIFREDNPVVLGMMSSSVLERVRVEAGQNTLEIPLNTNISIAEPAARIRGALDSFIERHLLDPSESPTLEKYLEETPSTDMSWERLPSEPY